MNAAATAFLGAVGAAAILAILYVALRVERAVRQNTRAVRQAAKTVAGTSMAADIRQAAVQMKRLADFAEPMGKSVGGLKASVDAFYSVAVGNLARSGAERSPASYEAEAGAEFGAAARAGEGEERNARAVVEALGDTETLEEFGER